MEERVNYCSYLHIVQMNVSTVNIAGMRGTALCAAIECRNLEMVKYLLQRGCDVNARDFDGEPPILLALRKDSPGHISGRVPSLDIIQEILQHDKCNVNKVDPLTKKSAIHFAVEQRMVEPVRWLIDKSGALKCRINAADLNGNTPLHLAVHEGSSEIVQVLVNRPKCLIKVYNKAGLTPLHICSNTGDDKSLEILLKRLGSKQSNLNNYFDFENELVQNVNAVTMFEKETSLHLAVRNGHENIMSLLLNNGAQVNVKNCVNNTPLMLSMVSIGQWQTKKNTIPTALIKNGANPNVRSTVRCHYLKSHLEVTPVIIAILNGNLELVKCLIANGADVNMTDNVGDTPLSIALNHGEHKIASYLLANCKNINVNIINSEGESCLHAALKCFKKVNFQDTADLVKKLINSGAEILPDFNGKTVIERALDFENPFVLDVIFQETGLSANRVVSSEDSSFGDSCSLIHLAVAQGLLDIVKVLLSHGADIDTTTSTGISNLYIAIYNKEYKLIYYLVENGCNLVNEAYIYVEGGKVDRPVRNEHRNVDDSDSESSEGTDYDTDDSDNPDLFHGDAKLRDWLRSIASRPRTLKLSCLIKIRKYFIENGIAFSEIDKLTLPEKLKKCIRYRE